MQKLKRKKAWRKEKKLSKKVKMTQNIRTAKKKKEKSKNRNFPRTSLKTRWRST